MIAYDISSEKFCQITADNYDSLDQSCFMYDGYSTKASDDGYMNIYLSNEDGDDIFLTKYLGEEL